VSTKDGLVIIDVTTPSSPKEMNTIPGPAGKIVVDRQRRLAYNGGLTIFSLKNLRYLKDIEKSGEKRDDRVLYKYPEANGINVLSDDGTLLYAADYADGLVKVVKVSSKHLELAVANEENKKVSRIKFSDGSWANKTYHMELFSNSLTESCESISGTIRVINKNGKTIETLGAEYYSPEYALSFTLSEGKCQVWLEDSGLAKQKFILSNMPKDALSQRLLELGTPVNLNEIAVLYGGIGNTLQVEINEASKKVLIEPVGVIVIGIDGLRQDVLYPATMDGVDFENVQDSEDYYVPPSDLNGLGQILLGDPEISSTQQYIMLPEVTAVFPSITLASWASIFTGKHPSETGILGNEFFARDLYDSATPNNQVIPGMQGLPSGMVTLSDGAFSNSSIGFLMYNLLPAHDYAETVQEKMDMSSPNQSLSPEETTNSGAPTVQTIYEWLRDENSLQPYFRNPEACMNAGECRSAVFFNHYARGADWWGTIDLAWWESIGVENEWLGDFFSGCFWNC